MKHLTLTCLIPALLLILTTLQPLRGASGGPDSVGYVWQDQDEADGPEYLFIEPGPTAQVLLEPGDGEVAVLTLSRQWAGIYGMRSTSLAVSRHGYIALDTADDGADQSGDCLPARPTPLSTANSTRLYVAHQPLTLPDGVGRVTYDFLPESPHPQHSGGVHIITWEDVANPDSLAETGSFQVLLFDNFDILFQYQNILQQGVFTTGIQNENASTGLNIQCEGSDYRVAAESAILISPPTRTVTTWEDEADSPAGNEVSLREALSSTPAGHRIIFDVPAAGVPQIISLDEGAEGQGTPLDLSSANFAIDASGLADRVTLNGGEATRHFFLNFRTHLYLENVRIAQSDGSSCRLRTDSSLIAHNVVWEDNVSRTVGGAIDLQGASSAYFSRCEFLRNQSRNAGGAITGFQADKVEATRCRFWRNRAGFIDSTAATEGRGGAINLSNNTLLRLSFCDFALNETFAGMGGAIFTGNSVQAQVARCTFDDNRANLGGAYAIDPAAFNAEALEAATFERCTFYRNHAHERGGAFYENTVAANGDSGTFAFSYCSILENTASLQGGGLHLTEAAVAVEAILLANNLGANLPDNFSQSAGGSLDATPGSNYETGREGVFDVFGGASNQTFDYLPLGYYGGTVRTAPLLPGSPGVDDGPVAPYTAGTRTLDARELPVGRDADGGGDQRNDVGAVEIGPVVTVTSDADSGAGSLREAIGLVQDGGVIRFSGVNRIELLSPLDTQSAAPNILIDGSSSTGITIDGLEEGPGVGITNESLAFNLVKFSRLRSLSFGSRDSFSAGTFANCRISRSEENAALSTRFGGALTLLHCQIEHCRTATGLISNNTAVPLLSPLFRATIICRDTLFQNNQWFQGSPSTRAVLVNIRNSAALFQRCSFTGNCLTSADSFFWMFFLGASVDEATPWLFLENSTVAENQLRVSSNRGYLFRINNFPDNPLQPRIDLSHCSIHRNVFNTGNYQVFDSFFGNEVVTIENSLFAENSQIDFDDSDLVESLGGNLSDLDPDAFGEDDLREQDPQLSPLVLGANGTLHSYPRLGSPCIDSALGNSAGGRDGRASVRQVAQDLVLGQAAEPDIGAVESGRIYVVDTNVDEQNGIQGGEGVSLREVIAIASAGEPVQVSYDAAVHNREHILNTVLGVDTGRVDIDGLDSGIRLVSQSEDWLFQVNDDAALSLAGLTLQDSAGLLEAGGSSAATVVESTITGESDVSVSATGRGTVRIAHSHVEELRFSLRGLRAVSQGHLELVDSAVTRCATTAGGFIPLLDVLSRATLSLVDTTVALNEAQDPVVARADGTLFIDRSTLARNGNTPRSIGDAVLAIRDSIVTNSASNDAFRDDGQVLSLGGNVCDLAVPEFDAALGDFACREPFLGPLADYRGDGVPEMPPLAASIAFDRAIGGASRPVEVLTVTTASDEESSPAGAALSLREALRDIAPGGTIIFASNLQGADIELAPSLDATLTLDSSVAIDGTSLLGGIDIVGPNLLASGDGVTLALHGVHLRGNDISDITAPMVVIDEGRLIASQSAFTSGGADNGSNEGALAGTNSEFVIENCTFGENEGTAGIIRLFNCFARFSFCTFAGNEGGSRVLNAGGPGCDVELFGNLFAGNGSSSSVGVSLGATIHSLGQNGFPDTPAITLDSSDVTGLMALQGLGGSFAYQDLDSSTGLADFYPSTSSAGLGNQIPSQGLGRSQFPALDGRGFPRTVGSGTEWGAAEFGAQLANSDRDMIPDWFEIFYGLNPKDSTDAGEDPDRDGRDNLEEFINLSDPFTPDEALFVMTIFDIRLLNDTNEVEIDWLGTSQRSLQFEQSEDLVDWSPAPNGSVTGDGQVQSITFAIPPNTNLRFYRLVPREL